MNFEKMKSSLFRLLPFFMKIANFSNFKIFLKVRHKKNLNIGGKDLFKKKITMMRHHQQICHHYRFWTKLIFQKRSKNLKLRRHHTYKPTPANLLDSYPKDQVKTDIKNKKYIDEYSCFLKKYIIQGLWTLEIIHFFQAILRKLKKRSTLKSILLLM